MCPAPHRSRVRTVLAHERAPHARRLHGSTAVSLVGSHCVADGGGALLTVYEGALGARRDLHYPRPRSRTRREALVRDLRQTVHDLPELARTLVAAARFLLRARATAATQAGETPNGVAGRDVSAVVVAPAVAVLVPIDQWDGRAASLGGNGHALLAALSARVAVHQGRELADDGTVGLIVPINDRTLQDTRANAVKLAYVRVDPNLVTKELGTTRTAIREALEVARVDGTPADQVLVREGTST